MLLQCHLVHDAEDQCAFVQQSCPDEEAGLFSYLQLYYCKLPHAQPVALIIMIIWMGLLFTAIGIAASDFFCVNLSTISKILGLSESLAGVTFLAFGNGSPDVFSTFAAMKTHSGSLAVGELIGAASFITAVVAGSMALVRPFKVARRSFVRDVLFFIVAAGFSMVFLADGHLNLWECTAMVGFYVFYVIFVVIWHWILRRRAERTVVEEAARSHFLIPGTDEATTEPYTDDIEEDVQRLRSRATTRTVSIEDFANLERGGSPSPKLMADEIDANDATRDRYLAEISNNMRVSRPLPGERRNTLTPIRPSLVGALEFNAVLSSLQRSRNIQAMPINLRRYSDDPTYTAAQQQDNLSVVSNPETDQEDIHAHDLASNSSRLSQDTHGKGPKRVRAVSANDALDLQTDSRSGKHHRPKVPHIDLSAPSPPGSGTTPPQGASEAEDEIDGDPPKLSLDLPSSSQDELVASPVALDPQERHSEFLAPPGSKAVTPSHQDEDLSPQASLLASGKPHAPKLEIPRSSKITPRSSPHSPFPAYHDDPNFVPKPSRTPSIRLPPPSLGSESTFHHHMFEEPERPLRWWPYKVLPPPQTLLSTLFPTLYTWKEKSIWEKLLGIVSAPSVFLLVITLPTVEADPDEAEELPGIVDQDPSLDSPENQHRRSSLPPLPSDSPSINKGLSTSSNSKAQISYGTVSPSIQVTAPDLPPGQANEQIKATTRETPVPSSKSWNRWLLVLQLFTGPFLIVLLVWANSSPDRPRALLLPTLYSLLASSCAVGLLLLLTSPTRPPRYRYLICYLGFVIAIAWISTIANEVVGVLKALGTILNISDAILGLTIFAVGNSCGDLVADITVARLGYPVMALSACFGGPMLNILLGIGLGGGYMTIMGAEKREKEHPGTPMEFKPYQVEVNGTLLISGVTLLVTLVGLLIVVPLRGWQMDRKVGWGLIALWTTSTIVNVVAEVLGWARRLA